jgi:hypothetical protein
VIFGLVPASLVRYQGGYIRVITLPPEEGEDQLLKINNCGLFLLTSLLLPELAQSAHMVYVARDSPTQY